MLFSRPQTDIGLRTMMRLAAGRESAERTTVRVLARQLDVSEHVLGLIVTDLVSRGLVESRRGRGGGLTITEQGRSTSVGDLARALEHDDTTPPRGEYGSADACSPLRHALSSAQDAFYRELDGLTFGALAASPMGSPLPLSSVAPPTRKQES
ncbi:Rrf2 family transcriptional regulator [Rhodococcus sp. HNM0569]|uniref:RrF2 family transcriptional regulator n=1 Tax=Rhodococcus sp. HNM0569 TaxID=2716340 RepID=UPI00146EA12F|nr:Rrf2 family transcriptional regulator [Rhodococcus sp. HNM0569]NLU82312.1 transcriptional regulator [Rhodococcus sp. HNM0569]